MAAAIERLAWDVSVPRDVIGVNVKQGWITLIGEVDWRHQKKAAKQDVRRLHGIVGVSNQIRSSRRSTSSTSAVTS